MFPRTFSVKAKEIDISDPDKVTDFLAKRLVEELPGRPAAKFLFFADADPEVGKIVFYDMSAIEQVIEFAAIFARLPQYSVEYAENEVRIYRFDENHSIAKIITLDFQGEGAARRISGARLSPERSDEESKALDMVASTTAGLLEASFELAGSVSCMIVTHSVTGEKRAHFSLRIDGKSQKNRAIVRSCQKMFFAWSEEGSFFILVCRFKMLPPFALSFPVLGENVPEAMQFVQEQKKAVGIVRYTDDIVDTFSYDDTKPTFEEEA